MLIDFLAKLLLLFNRTTLSGSLSEMQIICVTFEILNRKTSAVCFECYR